MTREHNFNVKIDEWERAVFEAAVLGGYFSTYNAGTREYGVFKTFPEGLRYAHDNPRALLYAVALTERHTVIPKRLWNEYAEFYLTIERRREPM